MSNRGVVIAMGSRARGLADALAAKYVEIGYEVYRSDAESRDEIARFYEELEQNSCSIETCIYLPLPLQELSLFDGNLLQEMSKRIESGLANGTWWIQQSCAYLKRTGQSGSVIVLNHVPSVVPDMKYSYCAVPEAALGNLIRVAVMDTHGNTDVRINMVTYGWRGEDAEEKEWLTEMEGIYGGAKAPILQAVKDTEIVDACVAAGILTGMNGNNMFVDHGYHISRTIRQRHAG